MKIIFLFVGVVVFNSCHPAAAPKEETVVPKVAVKVTTLARGLLSDSLELTAISSFIKKSDIRSSAVGYIDQINIRPGSKVHSGQTLFIVKTKEAAALGKPLFPNDPTLKFAGIIFIKAIQNGVVTRIMHHKGDYVLEGDSMCTLVNPSSLSFILNVPYEWTGSVKSGESCDVMLPDGTRLKGRVEGVLAIMDAASQTESYIVKPMYGKPLPENLIAKVKVYKTVKSNALIVPREALLANETLDSFWVMKVVSDTMAIKMPVKTGIETKTNIEIRNDNLKAGDRIVLTGGYGLGDTATIRIEK